MRASSLLRFACLSMSGKYSFGRRSDNEGCGRRSDLGDAGRVRLAELLASNVVYTVDRTDFTTYRKHGRQPVPRVFPEDAA